VSDGNGNGGTLDLTNIRLSAWQFVALFLMATAVAAAAAVTAATSAQTADAVQTMARAVNQHTVELAVHQLQIEALQDRDSPRAVAKARTNHRSSNADPEE